MWTVGWGRCKFPALLKVTLLKQRGASTSVFPDYGFGGAGSRSQWSTHFTVLTSTLAFATGDFSYALIRPSKSEGCEPCEEAGRGEFSAEKP